MTKIIGISDTHNYHNKIVIPECDILIHAGDMTSMGREHEIRNFFKWFKKQPAKHHVAIMGNHEKVYEQCLPLSKTWITEEFPEVIILDDSEVIVEGLKLWGSNWTPFFNNWAYNAYRGEEIKKHWDRIPDNVDILITHGPAKGILDRSIYDNEQCGCQDLLEAIQRTEPAYHMFGHIHNWGGMSKTIGKTTYMNIAVCDEDYRPLNKIQVIEI